jgi:1,2-diacylglycerol 3-beta-galactosyltransferase
MNMKKRILILTADAGFGHRSAANAVQEALNTIGREDVEIVVLNPLDDKRTPIFLRESQSDYDKLIARAPELYRLGYEASDTTASSVFLEGALTVMLFEVMRDVLRKFRPNVIVSTYPLYQAPLISLFALYKISIPLIEVVTDLATVHRIWFNSSVDRLIIPTETVKALALESGVPEEKILLTGIPVHPQISLEERSDREIRQSLGWDPNVRTILAVGSKRVKGMQAALNIVNHVGALTPLQLAVVCGKDEELYNELHQVEWHIPTHIYNFVTNMPELMRAADLMICKAGGLIVTESLASGLPLLLIDVIPGQETGNMEYVVDHHAGAWIQDEISMLEALAHLSLNDGQLMKDWAAAARKIGRPQAAMQVAELALDLMLAKPVERKAIGRSNLITLLANNHIRYTENSTIDSDQ